MTLQLLNVKRLAVNMLKQVRKVERNIAKASKSVLKNFSH